MCKTTDSARNGTHPVTLLHLLKAEYLKQKHTFTSFLVVAAPLFTILAALLLTIPSGNMSFFSVSAFNWWYVLMLPGTMAVFSHQLVREDQKIRYANHLSLSVSLTGGWMGKICYGACFLLCTNLLFFLGVLLSATVFGTLIPFADGFYAVLCLSIAYLWEIPLCLFLSARYGMFCSIFCGLLLPSVGTAACAATCFWWIFPGSIPIRLMCPLLGIQPNGLLVPQESVLSDAGVILPGLLLSLVWFAGIAVFTAFWFRKIEV